MTVTVLHVTRAFSAQPTLGECLAECLGDPLVIEAPMAEALAPNAWRLLATPARTGEPDTLALIGQADPVLDDEGVVLAAAALQALCRRRAPANV
jgi:hypothetical protein